MVMSLRLFGFVILLMPGWMALLKYYIFDSFIIRNIEYGRGARYRNVLDVFLPRPLNPGFGSKSQKRSSNGVPVVVFLSGGAWIIGYKLWSALMGREFARRGFVVIVPDYRNFPQGNIDDMIEDIRSALLWTVCNCAMFGGDPNKITLCGQSAGAHIALCTLVELYEESLQESTSTSDKSPVKSDLCEVSSCPPLAHLDSTSVLIPMTSFSSLADCSPQLSSFLHEDECDENKEPFSPAASFSPAAPNDFCTPLKVAKKCLQENDRPLRQEVADCEGDIDQAGVWWDIDSPAPQKIVSPSDKRISSSGLSKHMETVGDLSLATAPLSPSSCLPSNSLPLEVNVLGDTEYAADLINETALQNIDSFHHALHISDVKLFIGISGPYNMITLLKHLHLRGLDASILHHVFNSDVARYSPVQRLSRLMGCPPPLCSEKHDEGIIQQTYNKFYSYIFNVSPEPLKSKDPLPISPRSTHSSLSEAYEAGSHPCLEGFPQVALFHGGRDQSIPAIVCDELGAVLKKGKVSVSTTIYANMSHTDPILENVLAGETYLVDDMSQAIEQRFLHIRESGSTGEEAPVMVSRSLIYLARIFNPF
jgi:hypothetical protein